MTKTCKILWIVFLSSSINTLILATPVTKDCNKAQWSCHDSFYIGTGYLFGHIFYKKEPLTLTGTGQPTITYTPNHAEPNDFHGMRFSFVRAWTTNSVLL